MPQLSGGAVSNWSHLHHTHAYFIGPHTHALDDQLGVSVEERHRYTGGYTTSPGPIGGIGQSFVFVQVADDDVWEIVHDLGFYPGGVTAVDSGGSALIGAIEYVSLNEVHLHFSEPVAGTAYLS